LTGLLLPLSEAIARNVAENTKIIDAITYFRIFTVHLLKMDTYSYLVCRILSAVKAGLEGSLFVC
jgi:hypothetical protein